MAWAETITLLPLDSWAKIMGIDPWEFNGFNAPRSSRAECKDAWTQFEWQQDTISREEVARTIEAAEASICDEINAFPAPKYIVNEQRHYPRPAKKRFYGAAGTPRGQWKAVQLAKLQVQGGGTRTRTLIDADAAVSYTDPDSDAVKNIATITVTTTVTDVSEVVLYFREADRIGEPLSEKWRIRPTNVVISGGTATITAHSSQFAVPKKLVDVNFTPLDSNVIGNYVTHVDVYRVFRDDTFTVASPQQGTAAWEQWPCTTTSCGVDLLPLCIGSRQADIGIVNVAFPDCWPQNREPDRLFINYLAGFPLENGKMQTALARMVAQLATAWLSSESCACDRSQRIIAHWRLLPSTDDKDSRPITVEEINENPWGARRGAYFAWKKARTLETRFVPVGLR